ncbi:CDGSH iron-sulfur domain-containing protein [Akkermansiaceae bacterium]|nr:CDGSH iron-sulfur domain-containing protein [Akkermansiaceae bacterium]
MPLLSGMASEDHQGEGQETITLEAGTHWMCTCGKSANSPLCDGSHKGIAGPPKKLVLEEATVIPVKRPPAE